MFHLSAMCEPIEIECSVSSDAFSMACRVDPKTVQTFSGLLTRCRSNLNGDGEADYNFIRLNLPAW